MIPRSARWAKIDSTLWMARATRVRMRFSLPAVPAALLLSSSLLWAAEPATPPPAPSKPHAPKGVEWIENVVIGTGGGREIVADIARSTTPSAEPMPAVITIHGGGWSGGTHKGYLPTWLVEHGYFVATIAYRLSGESPWPAQIEDCKLGVRWLRANAAKYHVDPDRIGCMGHSAGGHLVACLGTLGDRKDLEGTGGWEGVSSRVQAVVDEAGPVDFTPEGRPVVGKDIKDPAGLIKLFGGTFEQKPEVWRTASPALHVTQDTPPFLVVHGENDFLVPIAQAKRMVSALEAGHIPVEFIPIKNAGHGLRAEKPTDPPAEPNSKALEADIVAFFDKYLKK